MRVDVLPALADNYIHILHAGGAAVVVDPGAATPVQFFLNLHRLRLAAILLTHAHADHTAGAGPLHAATGCAVYGPAEAGLAGLTRELRDGDEIPDLPGGPGRVIATPGHLSHHSSYYMPAAQALFCGDTLFAGGCGRLMGCPPAVMWASLQKLSALPPDTRIYCGHNYTADNLAFAAACDPGNEAIARRRAAVQALDAASRPTVPSTLAEELATNPFLRAGSAQRFAELRRQKDIW